jgi:uncharacterized membrane protein (UPF0127 family)
MTQLFNKTKNQKLSEQLMVADTMFSRMKGLLGKSQLEGDEMLWIHRCNSIHTFFMKFAIDCVFLNKQMLVCALRQKVVPWRMVFPILRADSVIEMPAGSIQSLKIQVGDQLHVGH